MESLSFHDGNITHFIDARSLHVRSDINHSLQLHSSFIRRLSLERELEAHQGCVNTIAWNSKGSLLISGSDDTRVNLWSYHSRKLLHSIDSGHTANIFCTKFVPETSDELVVSAAADSEVRLFNLSRLEGRGVEDSAINPSALFQCHTRRIKKLAVEPGNPNVVWSASEDATLRQHDFRETTACPAAESTHRECRNVLLDLRCGAKKSLADPPKQPLVLKSCDISPTRPHLLLVHFKTLLTCTHLFPSSPQLIATPNACSDAFARLYDRRMLPPLSSCRQKLPPPPCVNYFCPLHLSDHGRQGLHLTHVTFSPNGEELLLNYSGEHVYLMDMCCYRFAVLCAQNVTWVWCCNSSFVQYKSRIFTDSGTSRRTILQQKIPNRKRLEFLRVHANAMRYTSDDAMKFFNPTVILKEVQSKQSVSDFFSNRFPAKRNLAARLDQCRKLLQIAEKSLKEGANYYYGIEACNDVLHGYGQIGHTLMHECLCLRAALLLKRDWKHDDLMAVRDCYRAVKIDPTSFRALHCMAEALLQLGKHKEALEFAIAAQFSAPSNPEAAEMVENIRKCIDTVEAEVSNKAKEGTPSSETRAGRVLSLSDILYRSDASSDTSQPISGREDSDYEEELEVDFETSISGDEAHEVESSNNFQRSLNVRIHRKGDSTINTCHTSSSCGSPKSSPRSDRITRQHERAIDMKQRYVGHCNVGTDIKQASFLGQKGEYIASGSDDGRWFIWEKSTGRLIKMLMGDGAVVNCVQSHPFDCVIWTPLASIPSVIAGGTAGPETANILDTMEGNQRRLSHNRESLLPFEILEGFRMHEFPEGSLRPGIGLQFDILRIWSQPLAFKWREHKFLFHLLRIIEIFHIAIMKIHGGLEGGRIFSGGL
ncbi:Tetratricopeptide-like helical [Cynara cardunculus var. scolymus]|uniref:Tetratricopeptide-like helical n=1 Tax=Cynara cardunculus var. scolymus TaxID=59895 RepID=A0A103XXF5_CYNCS|nr:Tetratricopeptide-like helical [Cynara cardunculus var. scolymus]